MRRIILVITLVAPLALGASLPANAQTYGPPYTYAQGLASMHTGAIASVTGPSYGSGDGGVGIRRDVGTTVTVSADFLVARYATPGGSAEVCVGVANRVSCGEQIAGFNVGDRTLTATFKFESPQSNAVVRAFVRTTAGTPASVAVARVSAIRVT